MANKLTPPSPEEQMFAMLSQAKVEDVLDGISAGVEELGKRHKQRLKTIFAGRDQQRKGTYPVPQVQISEPTSKSISVRPKLDRDVYTRRLKSGLKSIGLTSPEQKKPVKLDQPVRVPSDPTKPKPTVLPVQKVTKKKVDNKGKKVISERRAYGATERLERSIDQANKAPFTSTHASPPETDKLVHHRAKRAARYALRKKYAPNYHNLSIGQKQLIDDKIAKDPELHKLSEQYYHKYREKALKHRPKKRMIKD